MSGKCVEVKNKNPFFWPLNLLPGLTHIQTFRHFLFNSFELTMRRDSKLRKCIAQMDNINMSHWTHHHLDS